MFFRRWYVWLAKPQPKLQMGKAEWAYSHKPNRTIKRPHVHEQYWKVCLRQHAEGQVCQCGKIEEHHIQSTTICAWEFIIPILQFLLGKIFDTISFWTFNLKILFQIRFYLHQTGKHKSGMLLQVTELRPNYNASTDLIWSYKDYGDRWVRQSFILPNLTHRYLLIPSPLSKLKQWTHPSGLFKIQNSRNLFLDIIWFSKPSVVFATSVT